MLDIKRPAQPGPQSPTLKFFVSYNWESKVTNLCSPGAILSVSFVFFNLCEMR